MGQVALGIRSLLIKAAIFFVMCALLVWALGGQLFPAPEIVDRDHVEFNGRTYFWRLYAGGDEPNAMHWELMVNGEGKPEPFQEHRWLDAEELIVVDNVLFFAARQTPVPDSGDWVIGRIEPGGDYRSLSVRTRLELEQLLEQIRAGEELPDSAARVLGSNPALDRTNGTADETSAPKASSDGG